MSVSKIMPLFGTEADVHRFVNVTQPLIVASHSVVQDARFKVSLAPCADLILQGSLVDGECDFVFALRPSNITQDS